MKQMRRADDFAEASPVFYAEQKEKWRQELQDTEQRRKDLLPQHQKMQTVVAKKYVEFKDKKQPCQKNVGKWAEKNE